MRLVGMSNTERAAGLCSVFVLCRRAARPEAAAEHRSAGVPGEVLSTLQNFEYNSLLSHHHAPCWAPSSASSAASPIP